MGCLPLPRAGDGVKFTVFSPESVSHLLLNSPSPSAPSPQWMIPNSPWIHCNKWWTRRFFFFLPAVTQAAENVVNDVVFHITTLLPTPCVQNMSPRPFCLVYGSRSTQVFITSFPGHIHLHPLAFITPWARALPPWLLPGAFRFTERYPHNHSLRSSSLCSSTISPCVLTQVPLQSFPPPLEQTQQKCCIFFCRGLNIQIQFVATLQSRPTFMDSLLV